MVKHESQEKDKTIITDLPPTDLNEVIYEISPNDEIISALANAYENRRARQVSEWELLRRKSFHAAV